MASTRDLSAFPHEWRAQVLTTAPLIAPARHFTYPKQIAGEEDALSRGALLVEIHPAAGGTFLATCALGFNDPSMPNGIFACPNAQELCAVAGGYAYIIDTGAPEHTTHIPLKPVTEVLALVRQGLLIFSGFHSLLAWGREGQAWRTSRLSWEGISLTGVHSDKLHGLGWNMMTDREVEFAVDLQTGQHTGGGF